MGLVTKDHRNPSAACSIEPTRIEPDGPPIGAWCDVHNTSAPVGIGAGPCVFVRLTKTGVKFREAAHVGHFQVFPQSNLKPWTPDEEAKLIEAAAMAGQGATRQIVRQQGRAYVSKTVEPGRGLRLYPKNQ